MSTNANLRDEKVLAHWPVCSMSLAGGLTEDNLAAREAICQEEDEWPAELQRRRDEKRSEQDALKAEREAERIARLRANPPKRESYNTATRAS